MSIGLSNKLLLSIPQIQTPSYFNNQLNVRSKYAYMLGNKHLDSSVTESKPLFKNKNHQSTATFLGGEDLKDLYADIRYEALLKALPT